MSEGGGEKEKTKEVNYIRYYFTDGSFITLNGVTFHSTSSTVDQIIIGDDQQFEIIRANMFYSQKQTTPFMD